MAENENICTKENPRPSDIPKGVRWMHPDAVCVYDGGWAQEYESYKCPHCGLYFSEELGQ